MRNVRRFQSGFSLIEVMIAVGILGIVSVGMASLVTGQQREFKALTQKADSLELRNRIMNTFVRSAICSWQLSGKVVDVSGTTPTVASPTILDFGAVPLYEGLNNTSGVLAQAGGTIGFTGAGIVVNRILFKDILATGVPNEYNGNIEIEFLPTSLVRPLKAIQIQQKITTNNATSTATITSCGPVATGASGWVAIDTVGAVQGPTHVSYPAGGGRPSVMCQNAGYNTYGGACRFVDTIGRLHEGSVVANTTLGFWSLSCMYGGNVYWFSTTTMSEILCVR